MSDVYLDILLVLTSSLFTLLVGNNIATRILPFISNLGVGIVSYVFSLKEKNEIAEDIIKNLRASEKNDVPITETQREKFSRYLKKRIEPVVNAYYKKIEKSVLCNIYIFLWASGLTSLNLLFSYLIEQQHSSKDFLDGQFYQAFEITVFSISFIYFSYVLFFFFGKFGKNINKEVLLEYSRYRLLITISIMAMPIWLSINIVNITFIKMLVFAVPTIPIMYFIVCLNRIYLISDLKNKDLSMDADYGYVTKYSFSETLAYFFALILACIVNYLINDFDVLNNIVKKHSYAALFFACLVPFVVGVLRFFIIIEVKNIFLLFRNLYCPSKDG